MKKWLVRRPYKNLIGMHCSILVDDVLLYPDNIGTTVSLDSVELTTKDRDVVFVKCHDRDLNPCVNLFDEHILELFLPVCDGLGFSGVKDIGINKFAKYIREIEFCELSIIDDSFEARKRNLEKGYRTIYPKRLLRFDFVDMMTMEKYSVPKRIIDKAMFNVERRDVIKLN